MNSIPFEKLTGRANFPTWKISAEAWLDLDNLWLSTIAYECNPNGTPKEGIDPAKDRKAKSRLILSIEPICYVHINGATSAKDLWQKLVDAYEDSGLTRRVGLLRKLITTTLTGCGSMDTYVNDIVSTAHALRGIGFQISEEWIGSLLLAGLPDEYRPMIMALESSGVPISGDSVKTKLLQEVQLTPSCDASALLARGKQQKKNVKCFKCHKYGHYASKCQSKKVNPTADNNRSSGGTERHCTLLSTAQSPESNSWYFDSGATSHMTMNRDLITNEHAYQGIVTTANKSQMQISSMGTVNISHAKNNTQVPVKEVKYIPGLSTNLLSVSKIVQKGNIVVYTDAGCKVLSPELEIFSTGEHVNGLFRLEQATMNDRALACVNSSIELWHKRMGHLNVQSLRKLKSSLATGINFKEEKSPDCVVCSLGKQTRLPFPKQGSRANDILEIVHSDICGPMEVDSIGGNRYFLTFTDDKSQKKFIYILKSKSAWEVAQKFEDFSAYVERQANKKIKVLRTDNGKEYVNNTFQTMIRKSGIHHQTTNVHTPEQNGLAERNNRSIVERARCMLAEAGLPKMYWGEAVLYAVYLLNRSPSTSAGMTPEEAWTGKKPDLSNIRTFGSKVMVHIPKANRKKFDDKAVMCFMTGFDEKTKGYRVHNPNTKILLISRDVTFIDEGISRRQTIKEVGEVTQRKEIAVNPNKVVSLQLLPAEEVYCEDGSNVSDGTIVEAVNDGSSITTGGVVTLDNSNAFPEQTNSEPPQSLVSGRSERERTLPGKYKDFVIETKGLPSSIFSDGHSAETTHFCNDFAGLLTTPKHIEYQHNESVRENVSIEDPVSLEDAFSRPDANEWKLAMETEYRALLDNNTWNLVELPAGRKSIKCKWVYRRKKDMAGNIDRYKARLVIKGYSQRKGEDYGETYSPVVRHSSLRYLFALAVQFDLKVEQMDAVSAFLQGELSEEIYMDQPDCFVDPNAPQKVCRLKKTIYGLKQSSRVWNKDLDATLKAFGLYQNKYDACVYHFVSDGKILLLAIYVDDILLFSNDDKLSNAIKATLSEKYKIKYLGQANYCLGIRIVRSKDCIALDQEQYIEDLLTKFGMTDCKSVATPMNLAEKLSNELSPKTEEEIEQMQKIPYQEAIGSLMYLAHSTRPDIVFAVNQLSRFNANPGRAHWQAVKHLLRYLRGTSKFNLQYRKAKNPTDIIGYSDADWGADVDSRKSTTGYVFIAQGGAISWCSKKQHTVALSSCEAEYMALAAATQEALWWRGLKSQIGFNDPLEIRCDNQSAIAVAKNCGSQPRSKHIDIRYHFIQDTLDQGHIEVTHVGSQHEVADALTKPLDRVKNGIFRDAMGIRLSP